MTFENYNIVFFDIETTGLDPFDNKIITMQVRTNGQTTIWKEWELGEKEMITEFLGFTDTVYRKTTKFVGYNILRFDIPFINERMRILGIDDRDSWYKFNRYISWLDLYQFLGDDFGRFRQWKAGLTGKQYETTNKDIPDLYKEGRYERIIEYIKDEMEGFENVFIATKEQKFYKELMALRTELLQ
jgi:DNA polymerase elongation subunit (family B)